MKNNVRFTPTFFVFLLSASFALSSCSKDEKARHYTVDKSASAVEWKGYLKDGNGNNGTIDVEGSVLVQTDGTITGGEFKMPLSSLININLPSEELKKQLIHHLQSSDFFDMAAHPSVGFSVTSVTPDKVATGTFVAEGNLSILGKTHLVNFPVKVGFQGNRIEITGETTIDRTLWGMTYASDENAADGMYVKPGIDVQFKLVATRN